MLIISFPSNSTASFFMIALPMLLTDVLFTSMVEARWGGGGHVKILTGMLVLFFGFEIWPNPIFLGWQIF